MSRVFIFHGAYGNPQENWIPWLTAELKTLNIDVIAPAFPTPENQSLIAWRTVFKPFESQIQPDSIFIAHSLGVAFALRILESIAIPIKSAFFVAGFSKEIGIEQFDTFNRSFIDHPFDWPTIWKHCGQFVVIQSDNDPYVPLDCGRKMAEQLQCPLTIVPKAGHFNAAAGYTNFDLLLKEVLKATDLH